MLTVWLVVFVLVAVNSFYVTAEFGAVSVRRSKIRQLAEDNHRLAKRLLPVLEDPVQLDRYIAACQIGITWSSLVLGAYSQALITPTLIPLLVTVGLQETTAETTATVTILVVMTTLQVVAGELVPKSLALQFPAQAALYTMPAMKVSLAIYSWFLKLLNGSGHAILRLLGFSQTVHGHIHSPEEIELLIAESGKGGLLDPQEHERLRRALRLVTRPVRQLMVPRSRIVSVDISITPEQLVAMIQGVRFTRLPVRDGAPDNIVGLLHTKDAAAFLVENGRLPQVREVMRPLARIPETVSADRLFALFRERRTHQAAVVDEHGVVGLVTLGDLIRELLGEGTNEFRAGQPKPERLPDGRLRLPGLMPLDEAQLLMHIRLDGPADTLAGQVMHVLGRVPAAGERLNLNGAEVEVERVAAHSIHSLLVRPAPAPEEA
jgi:CBS domain containing-hemolysin-like protein